MQEEVAFLQAAYDNGDWDTINNYVPDTTLTPEQRRTVLSVQGQFQADSGALAARQAQHSQNVIHINGQADTTKIVNTFDAHIADAFIQGKTPNGEPFFENGEWTAEGAAAIRAYQDGVNLAKQLGPDVFDQMLQPPQIVIQQGRLAGQTTTGSPRHYTLNNGNVVVPDASLIKEGKKKLAEMQAAERSRFEQTEASWVTQFGTQIKAEYPETTSSKLRV